MECLSHVVASGPLKSTVGWNAVDSRTLKGFTHFQGQVLLTAIKINKRNLLGKEVWVGRLKLVSSIKLWQVFLLVVGVDFRFLIRREPNRVDAVWIVEEILACGVDLDVLPAGSLPTARHQVHWFLALPGGSVDVGVVGSLIQIVYYRLAVFRSCVVLLPWSYWFWLWKNWSWFHAFGKALLVIRLSCTLTSMWTLSHFRKDLKTVLLKSWG